MIKLDSMPLQLDTRRLAFYLWMLGIALAAVLLYAALEKPIRYTLMVAATPVALIIVTSPRLALYQFVLALFIDYLLIPALPIYLLDISALLLISAATVDLLLDNRIPVRLPPLTLNYVLILMAMLVCGILGYMPELLPRRVIAYAVMVMAFLAVFRLSRKLSVAELLKVYVTVAAVFSAAAIVQFISSGGAERSFGFTHLYQDEFSMVGAVISFALLMGDEGKNVLLFRLTTVLCLGGLIATQSRAPIAIAGACILIVALVAWRRLRAIGSENTSYRVLQSRLRKTVLYALALAVLVLVLSPGLLTGLTDRFAELFEARAKGTTAYRLVLWKNALKAFWDHPLFGIGPGVYHYIGQVYPTWHLTEHLAFVRNLSAHNVFLHFLAEMGLVGGIALGALMAAKIKFARRCWLAARSMEMGTTLAVLAWAILFGVSMLTEAGWMWGHLSFTAVFFGGLLSRHYTEYKNYQHGQ